MELVAVDIGGIHARFALAEVAGGGVTALGQPVTFRTAEHASLETAWQAFGAALGRPLPRAAALAVASPIAGEAVRLTNNSWTLRRALIGERLGVDAWSLVNDFGAVGHAVAQADPGAFLHLCGPDIALPTAGITSICGPGTGLGVAQVLRDTGGYHVLETEGGHIGFAPLDPVEDAIAARLRRDHGRVSAERVVSGPGIVAIYEALAEVEGRTLGGIDDKAVWTLALDHGDTLALAALDRFFLSLGAVAGDLALAHGAKAVVIAGGLGYRLRDRFARSGFAERFVAKGRFRSLMTAIPVKLITHPQPGLFGAAAAFAQEHC